MVVVATPFMPGLETASSLPACSRLWGGARELVRLGMEVRAWGGSHLPPPTPSLVPTSSPAPLPKTRLGCSAMLHGAREGLFVPQFLHSVPVECPTPLSNIWEYPAIHLSQGTAEGTK